MAHAVARRFIRINELASTPGRPGMLPVSVPTIWRWVKEDRFPAPIQLGPGVTAFDLEQVEAFLRGRAEAAANDKPRLLRRPSDHTTPPTK